MEVKKSKEKEKNTTTMEGAKPRQNQGVQYTISGPETQDWSMLDTLARLLVLAS
jgi:hypothetical protein